jgi:hypothetical protein
MAEHMISYRDTWPKRKIVNRLLTQSAHCHRGFKKADADGEYCVRHCKRCTRVQLWKHGKQQIEAHREAQQHGKAKRGKRSHREMAGR